MADNETHDDASTTQTQETEPAAVEPAPKPDKIELTSAQLKRRLEETRDRSAQKMLDLFGFKGLTPEQAQEKLAALRAIEEAQLSTDERKDKLIEELKAKAERAMALEGTVQILVDQRFNALPEKAREAVDAVAKGNPERRLELISVLEATGAFKHETAASGNGQPATGNGQPKPSPKSTAPAGGAPASSGARNLWDEYESIRNPIHQQLFYEANRRAIERDRPAE